MENVFHTVNPADGEIIRAWTFMDDAEIERTLQAAQQAFRSWKGLLVSDRAVFLERAASLFEDRHEELAASCTQEMGKPIRQAVAEVRKCATAFRYYAANAEAQLETRLVVSGNPDGFVAAEPLGPVLCIMPWNFPCWQVVRFAAPALAAGNTVILKHAEGTTGTAYKIMELMQEAGFPDGVFSVVRLDHVRIGKLIAHPAVAAVSLTGSERAGRAVAAQAGAALKKCVLELGGNDPYVVLKDADLERAAQVCVEARFQNAGQTCIAAKRVIVESAVYDQFTEMFLRLTESKKTGHPLAPDTEIGPLARVDILQELERQVAASIAAGALVSCGGRRLPGPGFYYAPTVLENVRPGSPAFDDEVFGPVAALIRAESAEEALALANRTRFGLGGAVFTRDAKLGFDLARSGISAGLCAVNGMVVSDARLPFGGIRNSGFGRELGEPGLAEFINVKTLLVYQ